MDGPVNTVAPDHAASAFEYTEPVRALLALGDATWEGPHEWPDYAGRFGIGREHAAELIRLARDPVLNEAAEDVPAIWGPVHAWRALGQARVEEAVEPLIAVLRDYSDDDAVMDDVPRALGMIGPAALRPLEAFIEGVSSIEAASSNGWCASSGIEGVVHINEYHPEQRDACVSVLAGFLRRYADQDDELNAWFVWGLLDLKAVETVDLIRAAFDARKVDMALVGDMEEVEIDLGLRKKRATPRPRFNGAGFPPATEFASGRGLEPEAIWPQATTRGVSRIGRNDPCPCGSGKKHKKCCLA